MSDPSVFSRSSIRGVIVLFIYVDDIIISGSDSIGIAYLKAYLIRQFPTVDLGALRYFLGIKIARSKIGMYLSQHMYILDLLLKT